MFEGYMEKSTRWNKDIKDLEITIIQTESTNISFPSPWKKKLKTWIEEISNSFSSSLEERKTRCSDSSNWRKRFKEIKETKSIKTQIPKPTIKEEIDEDQWRTHTSDEHETVIVLQIENKNKQEDDLLISYIKQDDSNKIWIKAKINLAMDLAIEESAKWIEQKLKEKNWWHINPYLIKLLQIDSQINDHGIMPSIYNPILFQKRHTFTRYHYQNRKNSKNSSRKTWKKATFDRQNHHKHRRSSLSKRKMGNYDQYKTIDYSMIKQSKMLIHFC